MKKLINPKLFLILFCTLFVIPFAHAQVGIGTTTPAYTFEVVNTGNIGATSLSQSTNSGIDGVAITGYNTSATNAYNGTEGVTNYLGAGFTPSGIFGLAINSSAAINSVPFGVYGFSNEWQGVGTYGGRFNSGGADTGYGGLFVNDLGYIGGFYNVSDRKTKREINTIDNALNIINQLNPVSYYYNLKKYPNMGLNQSLEYGFVAQEVRDILPTVTKEKAINVNATIEKKSHSPIESNNEIFLTVDYTRFIPILTKAIKEQQSLIDNQNSKIETLEAKLLLLESKLNTILESQN